MVSPIEFIRRYPQTHHFQRLSNIGKDTKVNIYSINPETGKNYSYGIAYNEYTVSQVAQRLIKDKQLSELTIFAQNNSGKNYTKELKDIV